MIVIDPNHTLISPKELYEYMNKDNHSGSRIGINSIYKLMKEQSFPSVRMGGRLYAIQEQLESWITRKQKREKGLR